MYLSTLLEEGWIYSKNHLIKPIWLDKPTIANITTVSNNHMIWKKSVYISKKIKFGNTKLL